MFGAGGAIGLVSAIVGAGGGFISVPFMLWCNVRMHNAVATSASLGFPIAAAGTIGYVISGWHSRESHRRGRLRPRARPPRAGHRQRAHRPLGRALRTRSTPAA